MDPTLLDVLCYVRLHTLMHVVAQSLKPFIFYLLYAQKDTTTPNIVGLDKNFAFVCTGLF